MKEERYILHLRIKSTDPLRSLAVVYEAGQTVMCHVPLGKFICPSSSCAKP
jgi:hypothetical protein